MENTNKHPKIQAAEIVANAISELEYTVQKNGIHGNSPLSGLSAMDMFCEIAHQLKRIADALEKK